MAAPRLLSVILLVGSVAGFGTGPSAQRRPTTRSSVSVGDVGVDAPSSSAALIDILPAEERTRIDNIVRERSEARWSGDYENADVLRGAIEETRVVLPSKRILEHINGSDNIFTAKHLNVDVEYKVAITDRPRSEGGGSHWELVLIGNPLLDSDSEKEDNVLQLAHAALGMAVSASERGVDVNEVLLEELMHRVEDRLQTLKQRKEMCNIFLNEAASAGELHGRKAADAILWFALAGVSNRANVYNDLVHICTDELMRFGMNASCRAKDVLHIVERVAMAGIVHESSERLYRVAADCLEAKIQSASPQAGNEEGDDNADYGNVIQSLRDGSFGLHSDRPLLGLWRFSTRQRKQRAFFRNAARHFDGTFGGENSTVPEKSHDQYDWHAVFRDPSRPLVVDVGCGMGVSLLGLASVDANGPPQCNEEAVGLSGCNFVGVDLSRLAIGYARGVSERLGLKDLTFVIDSAETCLRNIYETYPGKVQLVMIQFPTPYRFEGIDDDDGEDNTDACAISVAKGGFNSQLPEGAASDGFMVSQDLLSLAQQILARDDGQLLIQSNCEDVAVHMMNCAVTKVGFQPVPFQQSVQSLNAVTQRAQEWVALGGERAIGQYWSAQPLLRPTGRTETEVACAIDGKPIHRCLLNPQSPKQE